MIFEYIMLALRFLLAFAISSPHAFSLCLAHLSFFAPIRDSTMIGTDTYHLVIELSKSPSSVSNDYRHSAIEVIPIDSPAAAPMAANLEPLRATSLGDGVIRLYREFANDNGPESDLDAINAGDDTMLSILAVPTYFTATDILGFIGMANMDHISHIRILKSDKPNRFLVLLKFKDLLKAAEFQYAFDGKMFNSMEPETCHVVFVRSVRFKAHDDVKLAPAEDSMIPFLLTDPFTAPASAEKASLGPNSVLVELPTCPVCLEKMDSDVTGLLTIACQHTFHCLCLSKWRDDTCPICRYSNNVANQKVRRATRRLLQFLRLSISGEGSSSNHPSVANATVADTPEGEHCVDCSANNNLWICLICGNVGCDRYAPEQHLLKHFVSSGHCFAMELSTSRVWDYAGDNYVHRLVANESDGKIVELPEKLAGSLATFKASEGSSFDKVDQVGFEYSQLLVTQLASQREHYEALLNAATAPKGRQHSAASILEPLVELEAKVAELSKTVAHLTDEVVPQLHTKMRTKDLRLAQLAKDLAESNLLNQGLSEKVEFLTQEKDALLERAHQLSEEVTDLMFFLESREKFKNESEDVRDGTLVIRQNPSSTRKPRVGRKK